MNANINEKTKYYNFIWNKKCMQINHLLCGGSGGGCCCAGLAYDVPKKKGARKCYCLAQCEIKHMYKCVMWRMWLWDVNSPSIYI